MRLPLIRVLAGFFCCLILSAQAPAPPSGVIGGVVLDANRQPIERAIITLSTTDAKPQDAVAWSDGKGRFAFGYLPAGSYELRVTKDGYQPLVYGAATPGRPPGVITLTTGEIRNDLAVRLQAVSSISGMVTDQDGDPIPGVQILPLRPVWRRGKRQMLGGPQAGTDRSGRYRLSGLPPGKYILEAQRQIGPSLPMRSEAAAGAVQAQYSYVPQYYPGVDRPENATSLSVEPGQTYSQIDFQLHAQPVTPIKGKIVLPAGIPSAEQVTVTAVREDSVERIVLGAGVSQPGYTFQFAGLAPGSYVITAFATVEGRRYRGVQKIETGSESARELTIPLDPGIDLSGTVSVEGPDAAKYPAPFVSLVPGDNIPWNGQPLRANVNKDGTYTIKGVPPGIWDINAGPLPPGGYIKSMRLGDQDVLTEEMAIESSTTAPLNIVVGTRAAIVRGEVTKDGQPTRAVILLAPENKFRHVLGFYRVTPSDPGGHFEMKGITPGKYQLFAFDQFDPQMTQDPEFVKPFESEGVTVELREGDNAPQKLTKILSANPKDGGEAQ